MTDIWIPSVNRLKRKERSVVMDSEYREGALGDIFVNTLPQEIVTILFYKHCT